MAAREWSPGRAATAIAAAAVVIAALGADAVPADPVSAMWTAAGPALIRPAAPAGLAGAAPLSSDFASSAVGVLIVDGGAHQCSASMVVSDSKRLLATAAHCAWLDGKWTLDGAYFVPGYRNGDEPWGRWAVDAAWVPQAWQQANSSIEAVASDHDVAFVRLAPRDGRLPEDALGGQGIWFDAPAAMTVSVLGYPGEGRYDGQSLQRCAGKAETQPMDEGQVLVMACDMTEGASGGPWLTGPQADAGQGQLVGVVSGGSGPELLSTRFGREAEQTYQTADRGATT